MTELERIHVQNNCNLIVTMIEIKKTYVQNNRNLIELR